VSRFGSARKLASWAERAPTVRGSDRVAHYGHISKQGSVWPRWVLCEAAQAARRSPQFAASFQAIATRRGKMIATIAAARKLLTRVWHLLTDAETTTISQATTTAALPDGNAVTGREGPPGPGRARRSPLSRPCRARRTD
jgi:hypothetical protein